MTDIVPLCFFCPGMILSQVDQLKGQIHLSDPLPSLCQISCILLKDTAFRYWSFSCIFFSFQVRYFFFYPPLGQLPQFLSRTRCTPCRGFSANSSQSITLLVQKYQIMSIKLTIIKKNVFNKRNGNKLHAFAVVAGNKVAKQKLKLVLC